jgi:hypothetical protein
MKAQSTNKPQGGIYSKAHKRSYIQTLELVAKIKVEKSRKPIDTPFYSSLNTAFHSSHFYPQLGLKSR